jgi:hypothetical protein
MRQRLASLSLAVLIGAAGTAAADETTFCNFFITSLPYTISAQGHYCFTQNLSTAITNGNAITINSDFVVLDLNNFKLGGGSAGLSTQTVGIRSTGHRNITVRNGNIRGFKFGIFIAGTSTTSGGHLIENNLLDGNTLMGSGTSGDTVVVRNNTVTNTGGSTTSPSNPTGIYAYGYQLSSVRDNVVANTFSVAPGFGATGIGSGYYLVADHNLVRMGNVAAGNKNGIDAGVCRANTVLNATAGRALLCTATIDYNYSNP